MQEVWLRSNRRALAIGMILPGLWLAAALGALVLGLVTRQAWWVPVLAAVLALPPQEPQTARGLVWQPLLQRDFVLLAPSPAKEKSVKALLAAHRLIGYDRSTVTGQLASRYLAEKYGIRKLDMEFDSIPAIISMVGLGMGVALLQIADPRLLQADAVRALALPADAPRMQYALLLRQADRDKRNLQALVQVLGDVAKDSG